eukprot:4589348-Amphidinium_carterae.1
MIAKPADASMRGLEKWCITVRTGSNQPTAINGPSLGLKCDPNCATPRGACDQHDRTIHQC